MTDSILQAARDAARRIFGFESLRSAQEAAIGSIMRGQDTFVLLSTSSGKSAIYQIPAVISQGTALVFSPLIALMKDQIDGLTRRGISAVRLDSNMDEYDVRRVMRNSAKYKLIYVAPERLKSASFLKMLSSIEVSIVVVDEAHIVSSAQRDFRPAYSRIGPAITRYFPRAPRLALTATADLTAERDIVSSLGFSRGYARVRVPPNRPNLAYKVVHEQSPLSVCLFVRNFLARSGGAAIVYAATKVRVAEITKVAKQQGLEADMYHGGLPDSVRTVVQDRFMRDEVSVIVATNAFGMGVDKADVRLVYHADPPDSVISYAQEAGRAGRDGKPSSCVLNVTAKGIRSRRFQIRTTNPPVRVFHAVWRDVFARVPVGMTFKTDSFLVEKAIRTARVSTFEAPFMVDSVLGYLEFTRSIAIKTLKTVTKVKVRDPRMLASMSARFPGRISSSKGYAYVTTHPGQDDVTFRLVSAQAVLPPEFKPVNHFAAIRAVEHMAIKEGDVIEKRVSAEKRLDTLLRFIDTGDKDAFIARVFTQEQDSEY